MAFVPAVVSSKKGLASRIHRILKDNCGNPRTGILWALTASAIAICLAVGVAFAQAGPSKPTGTIKTKLGKSAAIEQLASETIVIKGKILDPNNEPAFGACITAMPVISCGTHIALNNEEGYFELPWSSTWLDDGQSICLIAKGRHDSNLAALVEVTDTTSPVIVQLEPACTLTGKVIDPNGQRIGYEATLSLSTEFKCQAPIFSTETGRHRERIFSTIPYGTKYKLTIQSEGFQSKQVIVDATDRSKNFFDVGTITMQLQDPAKPTIAEENLNPDLEKEFHEVYHLDKTEIIKFIKEPFVLGRQQYLQDTNYPLFNSTALEMASTMNIGFHWDGELKAYSGTSGHPRLDIILRIMLDIPYHDFNIPKELNLRMSSGDWIIRTESPMEEQLRALEEVIHAETNRAIQFEKRETEREVIVARGRYELKSHPNGNYPNHVYLTWDGSFGMPEWTANSLGELFRELEWYIKMKIVDETESMEEITIPHKRSQRLAWIPQDPELKNGRLGALLDNLAKTTSLQFTIERRPAEIWFVTEQSVNK